MTEYKLTREEQETVILGNAASQTWNVCTADLRIIRLMERQGYKPDEKANPWGYTSYAVPFDRLKIMRPVKGKPRGRSFQSKLSANLRIAETIVLTSRLG